MIDSKNLALRLADTVMAADPDHALTIDDILGALLTLVITLINECPDTQHRATVVIRTLRTVVRHSNADQGVLLTELSRLLEPDLASSSPAGHA